MGDDNGPGWLTWDAASHGERMLKVETARQVTRLVLVWVSFIGMVSVLAYAGWTIHRSVEHLLDPLVTRKAEAGETLTLAFLAFRGSAIAAFVGAAVALGRRAFALLDDPPTSRVQEGTAERPEELPKVDPGP